MEPIADEEVLYRRISASACPPQYDPTSGKISDQAFAPHKTTECYPARHATATRNESPIGKSSSLPSVRVKCSSNAEMRYASGSSRTVDHRFSLTPNNVYWNLLTTASTQSCLNA